VDHRSSGEDFPYLSSHGSVEREPMESIAKGNVPGLATFYFPLNHDYWRKHYSIIFFNVEHHRHPNVQLVFLGWKPPQIPEAIYKHPEV